MASGIAKNKASMQKRFPCKNDVQ